MKVFMPNDNETDSFIQKSYSKFLWLFNYLYGGILFFVENSRKRYKYVLVGEKHGNTTGDTILQYRVMGKRQIFEMSAIEICNVKSIIGNFHPMEIRVISFIAGADQILRISEEKRVDIFRQFKKKMFIH